MMFFSPQHWPKDARLDGHLHNRLLHSITYNIAYDLLVQSQTNTVLGGFDKVNQEAERFRHIEQSIPKGSQRLTR